MSEMPLQAIKCNFDVLVYLRALLSCYSFLFPSVVTRARRLSDVFCVCSIIPIVR